MSKIKLGVLGLGRIGKMHIKNIAQMGGYEIVRGVDPFLNDEMERDMLELGVKSCSTEPDDVFNDPNIDAVVICSITSTHSDYIIRAARQKKDIFCEKPIDSDVARILEALRVVKEEGVLLEVGFVRRFDKHHGSVAKMVKDSKIGKPEILKITSRDTVLCPLSYIATSGGIFVDMMVHDFDMARYIMDSEVVEVFATGAALVDPEVAKYDDVDSAIVTLKFANGAIGTIENSRRAGFGYDQRVEVLGSEGCLIDDNVHENNVKLYNTSGFCGENVIGGFQDRYKDAFFEELIEFKNAINEKREPIVGGIDGLQSVLIAEAAARSFRSGKIEAVEVINI